MAVDRVAVPVPDKLAVPNVVVALSRNVTVPVGVPLNSGITVAVKATGCPKVGFGGGFDSVVELVA
jgi:hypothetical protein